MPADRVSVSPMTVVYPLAEGVVAMAVVTAMANSMGYMGMAAGMGAASSLHGELADLNERILRLSWSIDKQKKAVVGTREHKAKLMREYGLTILPSVVEMKKYPRLRATDYYLRRAEQRLDGLEVKMLNLQKRRRELMAKSGVREEEGERRRVYPATKKFIPPTERRY